MNIRRERVVEPTVVLTEVAVCFDAAGRWFVVRCRARVTQPHSKPHFETISSPLSRRQLDTESGGPELADFLMEHPGSWWRMPMATRTEEGDGL